MLSVATSGEGPHSEGLELTLRNDNVDLAIDGASTESLALVEVSPQIVPSHKYT